MSWGKIIILHILPEHDNLLHVNLLKLNCLSDF